jgi:hypothetical protein
MSCIDKLEQLLKEAGVPCEVKDCYGGRQVVVQVRNDVVDAICSEYSYGHDEGLLEIMGGLTEEEERWDSVKGYLTPEEVAKRFIYCYRKGTTIYEEDTN